MDDSSPTLANLKNLLKPLVALANLKGDSPEDVGRFLRGYPHFIRPWPEFQSGSGLPDDLPTKGFVLWKNPTIPRHLEELLSTHRDLAEYEKYERVLFLRAQVRELWRGGENTNAIARDLLLATHFDEDTAYSPIGVDWRGGKLVYDPLEDFQAALYALLKCSRLAKVCARPDCRAPYFVANRITQQYCSTACADAMQDEWRRRWWREHGNEWRKRRKKSKRKRGGKR